MEEDDDLNLAMAISLSLQDEAVQQEKKNAPEDAQNYEKVIEESAKEQQRKQQLTESMRTTLTLLAANGEFEKMESLIKEGLAEPDYDKALTMALEDKQFCIAIKLLPFAEQGSQRISLYLITAMEKETDNAKNLLEELLESKNAPRKIYNDALLEAASQGKNVIVALLMDDADDKAPALLRAAHKGYKSIIKMLIPRIQRSEAAKYLFKAIIDTAEKCRKRIVKSLITLGPDVIKLTLEFCVQNRCHDVIDILLASITNSQDLSKALELARLDAALSLKLKEKEAHLSGNKIKFECPICFEPCSDETKQTTSCGHSFCKECLSKWIIRNNNCPNCRKPFESL